MDKMFSSSHLMRPVGDEHNMGWWYYKIGFGPMYFYKSKAFWCMYHFETEFQIQLYFYISVKTVIRGKIAEDTGTWICVEEQKLYRLYWNYHHNSCSLTLWKKHAYIACQKMCEFRHVAYKCR